MKIDVGREKRADQQKPGGNAEGPENMGVAGRAIRKLMKTKNRFGHGDTEDTENGISGEKWKRPPTPLPMRKSDKQRS